jgi:hypothetical protein
MSGAANIVLPGRLCASGAWGISSLQGAGRDFIKLTESKEQVSNPLQTSFYSDSVEKACGRGSPAITPKTFSGAVLQRYSGKPLGARFSADSAESLCGQGSSLMQSWPSARAGKHLIKVLSASLLRILISRM